MLQHLTTVFKGSEIICVDHNRLFASLKLGQPDCMWGNNIYRSFRCLKWQNYTKTFDSVIFVFMYLASKTNYSEFKVYVFVCMSLYVWFSPTYFGEWKMLMVNLSFSSWNLLTLRVSLIHHVVLAWSGFAALTFPQSSKQLFIDRDSPCQSMKMCKLHRHIFSFLTRGDV